MGFNMLLSIFDEIAEDIHSAEDMATIENLKLRTHQAMELATTSLRLREIALKPYQQLEALAEITNVKITLRSLEISYERNYA